MRSVLGKNIFLTMMSCTTAALGGYLLSGAAVTVSGRTFTFNPKSCALVALVSSLGAIVIDRLISRNKKQTQPLIILFQTYTILSPFSGLITGLVLSRLFNTDPIETKAKCAIAMIPFPLFALCILYAESAQAKTRIFSAVFIPIVWVLWNSLRSSNAIGTTGSVILGLFFTVFSLRFIKESISLSPEFQEHLDSHTTPLTNRAKKVLFQILNE